MALARALVLQPKLLLLDEPLSALDAQIRKRLRDELKRLQQEFGFTAIFVTHDQEEAMMLGDVVAIMQSGQFSQIGPPAEIYNRPASLAVAEFIGDFNIFEPAFVKNIFNKATKYPWAIRPEAIDLHKPDAKLPEKSKDMQAEVTIKSVQVLGAMVRHFVRIDQTTIKVDALNKMGRQTFQPGDKALISIPGNAISEISVQNDHIVIFKLTFWLFGHFIARPGPFSPEPRCARGICD